METGVTRTFVKVEIANVHDMIGWIKRLQGYIKSQK